MGMDMFDDPLWKNQPQKVTCFDGTFADHGYPQDFPGPAQAITAKLVAAGMQRKRTWRHWTFRAVSRWKCG